MRGSGSGVVGEGIRWAFAVKKESHFSITIKNEEEKRIRVQISHNFSNLARLKNTAKFRAQV